MYARLIREPPAHRRMVMRHCRRKEAREAVDLLRLALVLQHEPLEEPCPKCASYEHFGMTVVKHVAVARELGIRHALDACA